MSSVLPGCARRALWRHRRSSRRGVADVLAIILMVLVVVVLAAILVIILSHYTNSVATTPGLSTSFALGIPQEAVSRASAIPACTATVCNFYNMTVQAAANRLNLQDLAFEIIAQNGSNYLPPGGIVVLNLTGGIVAQYTLGAGWVSGGTQHPAAGLTVVLYTSGATPASLSGDYLRVIGVAAYSGSIEIQII